MSSVTSVSYTHLIDNQTLDLMEQRRVGCVNGVRTVNTARRDNGIRMSDLKGILELFAKKLYGEDTVVRFRPHHFLSLIHIYPYLQGSRGQQDLQ